MSYETKITDSEINAIHETSIRSIIQSAVSNNGSYKLGFNKGFTKGFKMSKNTLSYGNFVGIVALTFMLSFCAGVVFTETLYNYTESSHQIE